MAAIKSWWRPLLYLFIIAFSPACCEDSETHIGDDVAAETENDSNEVGEDFVLILTSENFDDAVNKNPIILVEFYTPWCQICKKIVPLYAAAAEELIENDPQVVLAKIDASAHAELAERFEVSDYPTLIFFKNGKDYQYDGPGNKESIVGYMKKVAHSAWEPEPEFVITLTKDNFDDFVKNEKLMLVEFYVPRCGQCKKFVPVYERAAKELKKENPPIFLAKVNATQEAELATKYNVTNFPALKIFRDGRALDFKGEYTSPYDIMYYMKRQVGEGAEEITNAKMLKELFVPNEISIVGFFDSRDEPKAFPYRDLATEIRGEFNFGIVYGYELRKAYNINSNSVLVFTGERFHTKYEPKWYALDVKDETSEDIFEFLKNHHLPLVGQYVPPLTNHYDKKRPLCLVFYSVDFGFDHKDATQFWRHKIADVAVKFPDTTFAIADDEEQSSLLQQFGLDESGEELNVGLFGSDGKKYAMEPMGEFDEDAIIKFLKEYKRGELEPHIKSQRPPKKQAGPLTVVVGKTFEQIVKDSSRDVLIELYSPSCQHCKQLESKLGALAKKLKQDSNLVIAKMDATENDLPVNYSAPDYPTIYFAVASNKEAPLVYKGPWEVEDLEKFLREHAVASFGKNEKEEL